MIATLFVLSESRRNGPVSEQLVHSARTISDPPLAPTFNDQLHAEWQTSGHPGVTGGERQVAFLAVQPTDDRPVAYDPCRPIRYVVNAETAPAGAADLLARPFSE